MRKSTLNIPTGVIKGSEEKRLQKAEKKKSKEDKYSEYLQFLEQTRGKRNIRCGGSD